jgi:hypothetical protein
VIGKLCFDRLTVGERISSKTVPEKFDRFFDRFPAEVSVFSVLSVLISQEYQYFTSSRIVVGTRLPPPPPFKYLYFMRLFTYFGESLRPVCPNVPTNF